jgi:uncharacterized Tic20 family protein
MFLHFSLLLGFVIPLGGLVVPIILWQMKKEIPFVDDQGREVINFIINMFLASLICMLLIVVLIGVPLLIVLAILGVVFPIIGGIKANDGVRYRYPIVVWRPF